MCFASVTSAIGQIHESLVEDVSGRREPEAAYSPFPFHSPHPTKQRSYWNPNMCFDYDIDPAAPSNTLLTDVASTIFILRYQTTLDRTTFPTRQKRRAEKPSPSNLRAMQSTACSPCRPHPRKIQNGPRSLRHNVPSDILV